jgi:hypothetical protein
MKKLQLVFISAISLISQFLYSQDQQESTFYDAKFIYENCFSKDDGSFIHRESLLDVLLSKYYPLGTVLSEAELKKNPFFASYVPAAISLSADKKSSFLDKGMSAIGGIDVTKYANAIADLMIERAKQELTIAFFNRFKKFAEKNPEFQILFPKTSDNLSNLLTYTYPQMLPALRNGFFEDIKQITYHLDDILQLPRYQELLKKFPEVAVAIRSVNLVHKLETKTANAADIIKDFAHFNEFKNINTDTNFSNTFKNFGASVKLSSILSESLREADASKHRIWVTMNQIQEMFDDQSFFNIYMGLIYQQCKTDSIKFYLSKDTLDFADSVLAKQKDNLLIFQTKITELVTLGNKVSETLADLQRKESNKEKISNDDIYNYINVSIEVIEYAQNFAKIFDRQLISGDYLLIAKKSNALYKDVYSEEYTQAVNDGIDILKQVKNLVVSNKKKDDKDSLKLLSTFVEKISPYALFMGNMIEAKTEDQIKAALENVILPVGSSTIKKYTRDWGNISVQSYLGAYYSLNSSNASVQSAWTDKFGVIAPIGISWTPGCFSWKRSGSLSIFASLLDLGAIVDYKLKKDSTITDDGTKKEAVSKDYKIQLGQIFSPGGYLVYGFPWNLPLSFGFGAQYGPGLSKIDAGNNTVITNPSWRWNAFLAVDIPFFNIINKNKISPSK